MTPSQTETRNPFGRRDDRNASITFHLQQMRVAGDHEIGLGGDGAREHRVVVRVVDDHRRDDRSNDHRSQSGIALEDLGRGQPTGLKVFRKLVAGKDAVQLGEESGRSVEG